MLRTGTGHARRALNAFDAALVAAGVGQYNLIQVSSILPPEAVEGEEIPLPPAARLPIAYGAKVVDEPGYRVAAAVAVAVPRAPSAHGVIMELHDRGTRDDAERIVREMAEESMALREIEVDEIRSVAVEAVSGNQPTSVFAGCALVPVEAYAR